MSGTSESTQPLTGANAHSQVRTVKINSPMKTKRIRKRRSTRGKSISRKNKHKRQLSRAHHATVQSLAQINAPMLRSLGQTSIDLKLTHELRKALNELRRKEEDYRTAMEIGESLARENNQLRNQMQLYEHQLETQIRENRMMHERLETIEHSYHSDVHKYEIDRENDRQLLSELQEKLSQKILLLQQFQIQAQQHMVTCDSYSSLNGTLNINTNIVNSEAHAKMKRELEKEKVKNIEKQKTIEDFMERFDSLLQMKHNFEKMKKEFIQFQEGAHQQMQEQVAIQTAMQNEVVFVSSRNANLEEEKGELIAVIEQRDYEIAMLTQQLKLNESKVITGNSDITTNNYSFSTEPHLLADIMPDEELEADLVDIEGYLENEEYFVDYFAGDDEEYYEDEVIGSPDSKSTKTDGNTDKNKIKKTDDERAYDKIREFLHLTASAVKIKFPTVLNIQSHQLIDQVSNLPFHKFHDAMVRCMESELKKMRVAADLANNKLSTRRHSRSRSGNSSPSERKIKRSNSSSKLNTRSGKRLAKSSKTDDENDDDTPVPNLVKRASFFSLFFGREDSNNNSKKEKKKKKKKKNENNPKNAIASRKSQKNIFYR